MVLFFPHICYGPHLFDPLNHPQEFSRKNSDTMFGRWGQQQQRNKYDGDYVVDASHYISCAEMTAFGFSERVKKVINECDNYRNKNQYTNRSVDKRQDNEICRLWKKEVSTYRYEVVSGPSSGGASYVSPQEQLDRVKIKYEIAMDTFSETEDARVLQYIDTLRDIWVALNGDRRQCRGPR